MNILSFVSFILLVLSLGYYSFFETSLYLDSLLKSGKGYFTAQRKLEEKIILQEFQKMKGKVTFPAPASLKKDSFSPLKSSPPKSLRKQAYCECAKIDLSFLREKKNVTLDSSYQLLQTLLEKNYGSLFTKISAKEFLESLHWAIQKHPKEKPLAWENISLENPELQTIFYRIWKGTKLYQKDAYGFLPLSNLVKIDPEAKICLPCISQEMLEALVGEEKATQLWGKKERFLEQLAASPEEVWETNSSYQDLVCFSHINKKESFWICGKDETTEIEIKIPQTLAHKRRMLGGKS